MDLKVGYIVLAHSKVVIIRIEKGEEMINLSTRYL